MAQDLPSLGSEMIEILLRQAPRDGDGEVTSTLIGLHGAVRGYWRGVDLDDRGVDVMVAVLHPVEALLGRYRPRTLFGLRRLLEFIAQDMAEDGPPQRRAWLNAALDSARQLARLEVQRRQSQGIALLRLDSPRLGEAYDSPVWTSDRDGTAV